MSHLVDQIAGIIRQLDIEVESWGLTEGGPHGFQYAAPTGTPKEDLARLDVLLEHIEKSGNRDFVNLIEKLGMGPAGSAEY